MQGLRVLILHPVQSPHNFTVGPAHPIFICGSCASTDSTKLGLWSTVVFTTEKNLLGRGPELEKKSKIFYSLPG